MLIGSDGKEYDDRAFDAVLFEGDKKWTVLGPWETVKQGKVPSGGVYRPHVATCDREEDAKLIARLLTEARSKERELLGG